MSTLGRPIFSEGDKVIVNRAPYNDGVIHTVISIGVGELNAPANNWSIPLFPRWAYTLSNELSFGAGALTYAGVIPTTPKFAVGDIIRFIKRPGTDEHLIRRVQYWPNHARWFYQLIDSVYYTSDVIVKAE